MSFSKRPGTQRPNSSYAFSHQKGFAELIMSGRMTSQRRRQRPHILNHLVQSSTNPVPATATEPQIPKEPTVHFESELQTKTERLVE